MALHQYSPEGEQAPLAKVSILDVCASKALETLFANRQ